MTFSTVTSPETVSSAALVTYTLRTTVNQLPFVAWDGHPTICATELFVCMLTVAGSVQCFGDTSAVTQL